MWRALGGSGCGVCEVRAPRDPHARGGDAQHLCRLWDTGDACAAGWAPGRAPLGLGTEPCGRWGVGVWVLCLAPALLPIDSVQPPPEVSQCPRGCGEGQQARWHGTGMCRVPGTLPATCGPWSCGGLSPKPLARGRVEMGLREPAVTSGSEAWVCLTGNARDTSSIQNDLCQARWPWRVQLGTVRDRAGLPEDTTLSSWFALCPSRGSWQHLPISPYGEIDQILGTGLPIPSV